MTRNLRQALRDEAARQRGLAGVNDQRAARAGGTNAAVAAERASMRREFAALLLELAGEGPGGGADGVTAGRHPVSLSTTVDFSGASDAPVE